MAASAIGLDDDFFALGANSMTVLALAARLSERLSRAVPTHLLYSAPNARALAPRSRHGQLRKPMKEFSVCALAPPGFAWKRLRHGPASSRIRKPRHCQ